MYDVAISFAGEDRDFAHDIALLASESGLSVFYDGFEEANLWGKELASHLDTVYRKNALYCIVLISANYRAKIWPRHEVKSAFARAIESDEEYLLPVRLDETDLPGLSPTIGYLDARTVSAAEIVRMLCEKLGMTTDSTFRHNENLFRLSQASIPCTAFVIDRRYVVQDDWEMRLAVSFGENITDQFGPILAPPKLNGNYVLAMHCVGTQRGKLGIFDQWYTAKAYTSNLSQVAAVAAASSWLAEYSDEEYRFHATDDFGPKGPLMRSKSARLGDYTLDLSVG